MRSFAFSLAFCALSLSAQDQSFEHVRHFAMTHLDRGENLSCVDAPSAGNAKTITVEFSDVPEVRRGAPSTIDPSSLAREVFAVSNGAQIHLEHTSTLRGKTVGIYNYSFQLDGKTHAGSIFADANTGAISRMTFRGADTAAHLFCSARR